MIDEEEGFDTPFNEIFAPLNEDSIESLDPRKAFALGIEWAMFVNWLSDGDFFEMVVSNEGVDRCTRLAEKYARLVEQYRVNDACVELWVKDYLN